MECLAEICSAEYFNISLSATFQFLEQVYKLINEYKPVQNHRAKRTLIIKFSANIV